MATENTGHALDWDSPIENDSEFQLLPEGVYDFEVVGFDRERHLGSAKLPECNKAVLTLKVTSAIGRTGTVKHNLFLHTSMEGLLCAFFTGIGCRKHGERIKMDWSDVLWAKGRAKVGIREWKNDKGETIQTNDIKRFYAPDDVIPETKPSAPSEPKNGWKAGKF